MIDAHTSFFGLIGNPVTHSLSPVMHNQAFAAIGYNAVYLAFRVIDLDSAIKGIKALNFKGVSVTIPHKVAVMEYLDEVEETAATIGAVNTIVNNNGSLIGYNTDCQGALEALRTKTAIQGKSVAIIGAGGAARAIGFGLKSAAGRLTILNRSRTNGERLAADLQANFLPLNEWQPNRYEILVNTTPIGMHPETDASPIPGNDLSKEMVVMDIVYNPLETRFLKDAAARGCQTINGVDMFVFQGAYQFELWTGQKAPVDVMQDAVLEALGVKGT
ncbi:MAG: shikimate dehydrogenase [Desulfobacterales bacterium]|nr:shikimate dehydrogenase [Desulfobacterales bacterium]